MTGLVPGWLAAGICSALVAVAFGEIAYRHVRRLNRRVIDHAGTTDETREQP